MATARDCGEARWRGGGEHSVKTFWMIIAGACGVAALFFVFSNDYEKAFVAAAAGAVCWFLNYRQQLRESLAAHEPREDEESDEEAGS
jgi:hypothetical protein